MVRKTITDEIWGQLENTLRSKGCRCRGNERNIMKVILWKLRTDAPWRDIPVEFCPWKTAYNRFNENAKIELFPNQNNSSKTYNINEFIFIINKSKEALKKIYITDFVQL